MYKGCIHDVVLRNYKEWQLQFERLRINEIYKRMIVIRAQNMGSFKQ